MIPGHFAPGTFHSMPQRLFGPRIFMGAALFLFVKSCYNINEYPDKAVGEVEYGRTTGTKISSDDGNAGGTSHLPPGASLHSQYAGHRLLQYGGYFFCIAD